MGEINITQIDNVEDIDVVMAMYNSIGYSDNYSMHEDVYGNTMDSASFKFKQKIKASIGNDDTKNVAVMVPLEYLSKFLRTLIMAVINCQISVILTWSANCVNLMLLRIKTKDLQ